MQRRHTSSTLTAVLLAVSATGLLGCSHTPTGGAKDEKSYGAYMARQGFWREALFRFEKAAAEKPDDAQIQNDLAVACEAVGEAARALAAYRKAIELAPNSSQIKRNYARFAEYYTAVQRSLGAAPSPK